MSPLWIDHHRTAIEEYRRYLNEGGIPILGEREDGEAGCEISGWWFAAAFYLQLPGFWRASPYTTKEDVDVSYIAKARGGGDHAKAAGFINKDLPWWAAPPESPEKAPGSPVVASKEPG